MMAAYTFGSESVVDSTTGAIVKNGTGGKLVTAFDGPALPIYDLNNNPISEITSGPNGSSVPFKADVYMGLVQFGTVAVTVFANEVAAFAVNAQGAIDTANTAASVASTALATTDSLDARLDVIEAGGGGGGGTTDHGALSGLADDDHAQYHTDARGDARYYSKATTDSLIAAGDAANSTGDRARANHTGTQAISSVVNLESRLSALEAASGGGYGNFVRFSTLSGGNDDAKLASGITALQTPTLKGRIILLDENRDYTFTTQVTVPSGFALQGTFRPQDQARSSRPITNQILLRMAGASSGKGWLKIGSGSTFGISVSNLSIDGDANSVFFDGTEDNGAVLWTSVFRDISIQNAKGVFGTKANGLAMTACSMDGWWNINNVRETAWNWRGSDFYSEPTMMLVDSPPNKLPFNENLMTFSFLSNHWSQNVYCTAEGHGGIILSGSNTSTNSNWLQKYVLEGRNANQPSPGALVRCNSGQWMMQDTRFAFAMAKPDLITNRVDKGVIHVQGGDFTVQDSTYQLGNTVTAWPITTPETLPTVGAQVDKTVPFLYAAAGSKVRVRNIIGIPASVWGSDKPVVKQATAGLIDADDSVTLMTAEAAAMSAAANDKSTASANTGTSITINKPADTDSNVGKWLLAAVYSRAASAVYTTPPSGWTIQDPSTDTTTFGVLRIYLKQITGSEPANYTWAGGGSGRHVAVMGIVSGVLAASQVDVKGAVATGISGPERVIVPGVTTTADLDMLAIVAVANGTGGTSPTFDPPAGATAVASVQTTTGASESSMTLAWQPSLSIGATGNKVMTNTGGAASSTGGGYLIAVKSAG